MIRVPTSLAGLAALLLATPAGAQIRNAPGPRALEFAAYVFAASNVCGYRIDTDQFEALLVKQNTRSQDVSPRGPFGARVQGMFSLMSNDMALHRERACPAVLGEFGPEGSVAKNLLLVPASAVVPAPKADAPAAQNAKPDETKPDETKPEDANKPAPDAPAGKPPQ